MSAVLTLAASTALFVAVLFAIDVLEGASLFCDPPDASMQCAPAPESVVGTVAPGLITILDIALAWIVALAAMSVYRLASSESSS